jgi:hypothetical protein
MIILSFEQSEAQRNEVKAATQPTESARPGLSIPWQKDEFFNRLARLRCAARGMTLAKMSNIQQTGSISGAGAGETG